jgi:hypothetical protein
MTTRQTFSRRTLLAGALTLAAAAFTTRAALAQASVTGSALMRVPQDHAVPLLVELGVSAVGVPGAPGTGLFVACFDDGGGEVRLVGDCKSVTAVKSRTFLGGLGRVKLPGGVVETNVPWHSEITQTPDGTDVGFSFVSPSLGHIGHGGLLMLGGISVSDLAAAIYEGTTYCSCGLDPNTSDTMHYQFGALLGPDPADGFGSFTATVNSARYPDVDGLDGFVETARIIRSDETGDVTVELTGIALVYLTTGGALLEATFTLRVTDPGIFIGPNPVRADLEVLEFTSDWPILCLTNVQSDDPIAYFALPKVPLHGLHQVHHSAELAGGRSARPQGRPSDRIADRP